MSKDLKPQLYYYIRRGWYGQLAQACDNAMSKKGKDPVTLYWHAFALGMMGQISDCLRELESFQSRRDLQLPMAVAMIYFHQKASSVDREAVSTLKQELSVAETVTKENGLILAARFHLFVGNYYDARQIAKRLIAESSRNASSNTTTVFEMEAYLIDNWCTVEDAAASWTNSAEQRKVLCNIENSYQSNSRNVDMQDLDSLMCYAKAKFTKGLVNETLAILNQAIATNAAFLPALADKGLILANLNDWEQALDTAQRLLDADPEHLDALALIAVHAFTQESQPHDAVQKLEDLDNALKTREPLAVDLHLYLSSLFSKICSRQPRALQICLRLLERVLKACKKSQQEAKVYCAMGHIFLMQGSAHYEKAMKAFKDATKRDAANVKVLMGMVLCQICEGAVDDAEAQIELLSLMHTPEDLGYELLHLQSLVQKSKKGAKKEHYATLQTCYESFLVYQQSNAADCLPVEIGGNSAVYLQAFSNLMHTDPEFAMSLAIDFFSHMESTANASDFTPSSTSSASFLSLNNDEEEEDDSDNRLKGSLIEAEDMQNSLTKLEVSPAMQMGAKLLQSILTACPGSMHAYLELSRAYSAMSMHDEALRSLSQALGLQPQSSVVLLSMALLEAGRQKTQAADRLLDQALACDFSVRGMAKFKLVKGIVRAQQGRFTEALTEIEQVLALPDFGFSIYTTTNDNPSQQADLGLSITMGASNASYSDALRLTDDDKVLCCVVYASILSKEHRMKEAQKALSQAKVIFAGSAQEVQVLVASAQLYVDRGDYDAAVRMLDKIGVDNPAYARGQMIKADIMLNHNHDREGYTKCFQSLAEREPSAKNYVLLGDSYLRILNPEAAIDALEKAYELEPRNSRLRAKIGRALVSTHEYHRAVEFYEAALRELNARTSNSTGNKGANSSVDAATSEKIALAHDLARLYMKLSRYESADRVLNSIIYDPANNAAEQQSNIISYTLLVQVYRQHSPTEVIPALLKIYSIYKTLNTQMRSNMGYHNDSVEESKAKLSNICNEIALEIFQIIVKNDTAHDYRIEDCEKYLNEGNQYHNQSTDIMLSLAKVYKHKKQFEQCQVQCNKIISINGSNVKDALLLLSEVLLFVSDADKAVEPILAFLNSNSSSAMQYDLLERGIVLLRRAGKLNEVKIILSKIEKRDKKYLSQAGYHYCHALYLRYTNEVAKAVLQFNMCRRDEAWAALALVNMIELYLNPDQDGIWEEKESGPVDDATRANIAAAEQLLKELKPIAKDEKRVQVLENYCSLMSRNKLSIDRALQNFSDMLEQDPDYLPAVLGMATCFMIDKNQHKARNLLKRVGKLEQNEHDGEDFEKANLLLAKFYIDKGKPESAQEVCRKLLLQNKSCSQAWEILGLIFEKDANYEMAADAYAKAWVLEFEASAPVGFKLAFSYLKSRRLVEAVDVCSTVLKLYPDYPRIREEILNKALAAIRTAGAIQ